MGSNLAEKLTPFFMAFMYGIFSEQAFYRTLVVSGGALVEALWLTRYMILLFNVLIYMNYEIVGGHYFV